MLVTSVAFALGAYLKGPDRVTDSSPAIPLAWREGLLCVPISLMGGKPTWFLLDTGCYRSFLTRKAFLRLQSTGAKVHADGTLTAEGASIGDYPVAPLTFAPESELFKYTVDGAADGYLGMDFLEKYRIGLDLKEKVLRLWPTRTTCEAATREWFAPDPLTESENVDSVPILDRPEGKSVMVGIGNLIVPMVLDTGCPETFLHSELASLLIGAKKGRSVSATFYNGLHKVRTYSVPSIEIGNLRMGERKVSVAGVARMVGLFGRDLLSNLRVLIDYPGGQMYFTKPRTEITEAKPIAYDGPQIVMLSGVVVRYPRGIVAHVPAFCTYTMPPGYREVYKDDESVDLIPPRDSEKLLELTAL